MGGMVAGQPRSCCLQQLSAAPKAPNCSNFSARQPRPQKFVPGMSMTSCPLLVPALAMATADKDDKRMPTPASCVILGLAIIRLGGFFAERVLASHGRGVDWLRLP